VRPPLTKFKELGEDGRIRVEKIKILMGELDQLLLTLAS
jgi:hypothetical protein